MPAYLYKYLHLIMWNAYALRHMISWVNKRDCCNLQNGFHPMLQAFSEHTRQSQILSNTIPPLSKDRKLCFPSFGNKNVIQKMKTPFLPFDHITYWIQGNLWSWKCWYHQARSLKNEEGTFPAGTAAVSLPSALSQWIPGSTCAKRISLGGGSVQMPTSKLPCPTRRSKGSGGAYA